MPHTMSEFILKRLMSMADKEGVGQKMEQFVTRMSICMTHHMSHSVVAMPISSASPAESPVCIHVSSAQQKHAWRAPETALCQLLLKPARPRCT